MPEIRAAVMISDDKEDLPKSPPKGNRVALGMGRLVPACFKNQGYSAMAWDTGQCHDFLQTPAAFGKIAEVIGVIQSVVKRDGQDLRHR
jgi:hypothetical protein